MIALGLSLGLPFGGVPGATALSPPTVAPVLMVSSSFGGTTANLSWTESDQTGTAGFAYHVHDGEGAWLADTTSLTYDAAYPAAAGGLYGFTITPFNDAGDGPDSNTASIILPGESDVPVLSGPENASSDYEITWTAIDGADSYDVLTSADGSSFTLLSNTAALSLLITFEFSPLYCKVIPKCGELDGHESNTLYVATTPPAADVFLLNAGGNLLLNAGGSLLLN